MNQKLFVIFAMVVVLGVMCAFVGQLEAGRYDGHCGKSVTKKQCYNCCYFDGFQNPEFESNATHIVKQCYCNE